MRLRDYENLLNECISEINSIDKIPITARDETKITNLTVFMGAIVKLHNAGLLNNLTSKILSKDYLHRSDDFVVIRTIEFKSLNQIITDIVRQSEELRKLISNILPEENPETVNIKIPSSITSLKELKVFIGDLEVCFRLCKQIGCDTKIVGVDSGSSWIQLLLGGVVSCLPLIFWIAKNCLELRNLKLEGDRKLAEIEELKTKANGNEIDNIIKLRQQQNKEDYDKKLIELAEEGMKYIELQKENAETQNTILKLLKDSIEKMGELIDKGMEIKPAISASEEIKKLSVEVKLTIEEYQKKMIGINETKLIEQKSDEENQGEQNEQY